MANHKCGRRKNARSGCLLCHPYKASGMPPRLRARPSDRLRLDAARSQDDDLAEPRAITEDAGPAEEDS